MRLIFFGSGAFGLPTLQSLSITHDIVAVVSQPDRPAGRGGKLSPTPIAGWAAERLPAVPLIKAQKVNAPDVVAQLRDLNADAWVVIAFGQKLGRALLAGPDGAHPVFAINLHASLLPRWRGAAPIAAAILAGDVETGNSIITLADRMDAGVILGQTRRPIEPWITAGELHDALSADGPALVERVLSAHAAGSIQPVTQDESGVTIAGKLDKSSGAINFDLPADFLRRQIHALTPWPGVAVTLQPEAAATDTQPGDPAQVGPLKLLRVQAASAQHEQETGRLTDLWGGLISCGKKTMLKALEVQPAGKKPMKWEDFVRGGGRMLGPGWRIESAQEDGKAGRHA